jgi:hypothetical protein
VLGQQRRGAAELGARAETLEHAQEHEQDRRPDPDRLVGGQQPDQAGREAHHERRDDQRLAAPDAVAEMPEDHAAEGARDKADAERRERDQRAGARDVNRVSDLGGAKTDG